MSEHISMVSFLGQHIAIAHFFDFFSWLAHCHCHNKPVTMTMTLMRKVVLVVDRGVCMQPKLLVLAIKLHQFANWNNKIKAPTNFDQSKCFPIFNFKRAFEKFRQRLMF
jgi:hypothetical protein